MAVEAILIQALTGVLSGGFGVWSGHKLISYRVGRLEEDLKEHKEIAVTSKECEACQKIAGERRTNCKDAIARMEKVDCGMQEHIEQLTKCINQLKPECL